MQSLRLQHATKVLPPGPASIPIILVHDHTQEPIITTHYVNGANELNFESIYKSIKSLLKHPACSHRQSENHWPCSACSKTFSTIFWECACRLLDYFADFLVHDNGNMASLWFYLVDIWQETHAWFPCDAVLSRGSVYSGKETALLAARSFKSDFNATLKLVDAIIHGTKGVEVSREKLIHTPSGDTTSPAGPYNTGPWISGLKPWEQFLRNQSPGVVGFSQDDSNTDSVRHVPMAALGIVKTHTQRARRLAMLLNPDTEFLHAFDENSLVFLQSVDAQSHAYTSLDGVTTTYRLVNGAPPIERHVGYGDSNHLCSNQTFTILDEFLGQCRDVKAYESVSGDQGADDGHEGVGAFDMWAVSQREDPGSTAKDWNDVFSEFGRKSTF
jgi:hypothetical protein